MQAERHDVDITFEQLMEADLDHRLEEKLRGR